ncbi:MAG: potassium channel protein [Planctomycetia bacterium]|nr:potassium channel protein [Planctomycetia bacterium]
MNPADQGRPRVEPPPRAFPLLAALIRRRRLRRLEAQRVARRARIEPTTDAPAIWQRVSVRRVLHGVAGLGVVVVAGVLGYLALGWGLSDAFYMVVITVAGVGYGEVRPVRSAGERTHTILIITFGMLAVGYTLARFIQFLAEGEIQNLVGHHRMRRQIETLAGHTVVAGYGRIGALVCQELAEAEMPFVVIELSTEKVPEVEGKGFLHVQGDATEEKTLRDAGLDRARTLVTVMPNDAANVFITLTARQMAPSVKIVARAELPSTQKKLKQAGADHVILPALIGAHRIVSLLTNPTAVEFAELVTQRSSLAIEMDDVPIRDGSPLRGQTLRDADIGRRTGIIVIAVKRADGRVEFPPSGDESLVVGDSIVVLGRRANLDQFRKVFGV